MDDAYRRLEEAAKGPQKPQQAIGKRLQAAKVMIQADSQWGEAVRRNEIPADFRSRYQVENLYCVDPKNDVRCFYTIDEQDVVFLDIVDHKEHDKWCPPKGQRKRRS